MLKKNKLLTGVVFPLMSIAIAVDPAFAASVAGTSQMERAAISSNVLMAQAEPSAEELLKKQRKEPEPQAEQPKAEQPKAEQRQEEAPRPRKEAAPEAAPEPQKEPQQRPRREAAPEAAPEQQQRPRREAAPEAAPEPQKEPQQPRPRRDAKPDAAPAEANPEQQPEKPRRPQRDQRPAAEGEQRPARPPRTEAQPDAAPAEAKPEQQPETPRRPQRDQKPAAAEEAQPPARAQDKQPAAGEPAPEKPAAVPEKKPAAPEPDPNKAPVPTEAPAPGKPPAPKEQPNPAPGQQPSEQQRPPRGQSGEQQPAVPNAPTPAPQDGKATGQAPAGEPVPDQIAAPQQEAAPSTKEQLDKARAVAKDPSKSADTVILPVDKGAAVLDSDKEAERSGNQQSRDQRRQEREAVKDFKVPTSDAEAQAAPRGQAPAPQINIQAITTIQGERIDRRPEYERPEGVREWQPRDFPRGDNRNRDGRDREPGDRIFLQFGDRVVVRGDDNDRFIRDGAEPYYERLPEGRVRETIERRDGTQVVTIRNRYGDVIQRSRIDDRGREYVLFYAPELVDEPDREYVYRDPGLDLPPMRLRIPVRDYIIDTSSDPDRDYYRFLEQPPVEPVERVYSLDEVRYSARIRDKVRRIDLDTITFATGSAEIPMSQAQSLRKVADAMNKVLKNNPAETFLIEGHTDAVGSDESNLVLSDERAASVANVLTDVYGIPPENFATQGYGERFLKVQTLSAAQENRRVTIRRVTPLVKPVAQR